MIYLIFVIIFILNLVLFTKISKKINLVDNPNNRKIHLTPTPMVGGIVIIFSILIISFFVEASESIFFIFYVSLIIFLIGILDDMFQINIQIRFFFQFLASSLIIGSGIKIINLGGFSVIPSFELGIFGIFLTFFAVLCLINAINFLDGLNGLSSGTIIISLLSIFIFSFFEGKIINESIFYFLLLSIFCFFLINIGKTPFKIIFLGDSGSTTLGFLLSFFLIYFTLPETRFMHPVLAIWCIAFPMYELLSVIIKRIYLRINIFNPDNRHIHHILLKNNFSQGSTLFILLFISALLNFSGFIIYILMGPGPSLVSFIILFFVYYNLSNFYYKKV